MLNACRRQRSVHPSKRRSFRPSASAQRLSASKIGSHKAAAEQGIKYTVLNACRRQRSVHTDKPVAVLLRFEVLNACRRQRSVHFVLLLYFFYFKECSTPVGVKDRFTNLLKVTVIQVVVLNACRRQRSVHSSLPESGSPLQAGAQRLSASKIGSRPYICDRSIG